MSTDTVFAGELWEGAVANVIALASQAHVELTTEEGIGGEQVVVAGHNPVFESPNHTQPITTATVGLWVQRVASQVLVTAHRLLQYTPERRAVFIGAFCNAVELGAAAYLVDAAFPTRSGVNDNSSYGDVLWTRHRQALAQLVEAVEADTIPEPDPSGSSQRSRGRFPRPLFTDRWVRGRC